MTAAEQAIVDRAKRAAAELVALFDTARELGLVGKEIDLTWASGWGNAESHDAILTQAQNERDFALIEGRTKSCEDAALILKLRIDAALAAGAGK